jgi:hypothetical protein
MLTLRKREPQWLTLIPATGKDPAVRAKFAPITRAMRRKAAQAVRGQIGGLDASIPTAQLSDEDFNRLLDAGEAGSRELIRCALLDQPEPGWEGIGDESGQPLPVNEETVEMALDNDRFFEAADRLFVLPESKRDAEGNASAVSPGGTGEAATPASDTANSPARPKRGAGAKSAPTKRTRSKPRREKPSGG